MAKLTKAERRAIAMRNLKKAHAALGHKSGKKSAKKGAKSKTYVSRRGVGSTRKKGKVIGYFDRKPGKLYYTTANGALVETDCKNGGCKKKKPLKGGTRLKSRR